MSRLCFALLLAVAAGGGVCAPRRWRSRPAAQARTSRPQRAAAAPADPAGQQRAGVARGALRRQPGYTTVQGRETGVLVQSPRRDLAADAQRPDHALRRLADGWRVLAADRRFYYLARADQAARPADRAADPSASRRSTGSRTGRWRSASWCSGCTGLVMLFGKHVLLPVIGYTLFAWLATLSQEPAQLRRAVLLGRRSRSSS